MRSKRGRSQSKFLSFLKVPIRVLSRARDLYVQSLTGGGGVHVSFGNAMGCPTLQIVSTNLPRSMSVNSCSSTFRSADEKFRDLIRRGGDRTGNTQPELRRTRSGGGGDVVAPSLARSKTTVAFGRIDEDKAFDFGEDGGVIGVAAEGLGFPMRSRSYAASSTRVKFLP